MADRHSEYWRGPKADVLQQEFRDLVEVRDRNKAREDVSIPEESRTVTGVNAGLYANAEVKAVTDRIAEIQGLMADRDSEYWTGPKADALQQEYRDLIKRRDRNKRHDEELSIF